jgi:hypothetical protein
LAARVVLALRPESAASVESAGTARGVASRERPAIQPSRAAFWKIGSSAARAVAGVAPGAVRPMMRIHQYQGCTRSDRPG